MIKPSTDPGPPLGPLSRLLEQLARLPAEPPFPPWSSRPLPGDRLGRFEIGQELGRGGFGAVFEARDTELGRTVALKVVRPHWMVPNLSEEWVRREAEAVAKLDHPCIVTLHDAGTSDRGPYLVMELLEGETLARRLGAGPPGPRESLRIAVEVARGLAHAHVRGVLHRDLKPSNVFLCEDGRVKLLDFGLAHLLGSGGSGGSGTPGYMPPEQEQGRDVDARADVYAAAMTFRETLTGDRSRPAGNDVPGAVRRALERALSPSPDDRPSDGAAWLAELEAARGAIDRPRRLARLAAVASVAVGLGAAGAWIQARRAGAAPPVADARDARLPSAPTGPASPSRAANPEAHDLFLLGRHLNERGAADYAGQSVTVLERSIALDPNFAPAHAMLFFALRHLEQTPEVRRRRKVAAERAVELDPLSPAAHAARAAQRSLEGDDAGAREEVERSLELGPSDVIANMFAGVFWAQRGRLDEAVARGRRATEIDPLDTLGWNNLGTWLTHAGDLDAARGAFRRALELNPEETAIHCLLADVEVLAGDFPAALAGYGRCPAVGYRLSGIAMAEHAAGRKAESDAALAELERRGTGVGRIAAVHAWRGDRDKAFEWLARFDREGARRGLLRTQPFLAGIRDDPRFPELLGKFEVPGAD